MSWLKKKKPIQNPDRLTITAKEARKLAKATSANGYNVFESIIEKATAGRMNLYVNLAKLSPKDIEELRGAPNHFNVREVKQGSAISHFSIEW